MNALRHRGLLVFLGAVLLAVGVVLAASFFPADEGGTKLFRWRFVPGRVLFYRAKAVNTFNYGRSTKTETTSGTFVIRPLSQERAEVLLAVDSGSTPRDPSPAEALALAQPVLIIDTRGYPVEQVGPIPEELSRIFGPEHAFPREELTRGVPTSGKAELRQVRRGKTVRVTWEQRWVGSSEQQGYKCLRLSGGSRRQVGQRAGRMANYVSELAGTSTCDVAYQEGFVVELAIEEGSRGELIGTVPGREIEEQIQTKQNTTLKLQHVSTEADTPGSPGTDTQTANTPG